MKLRILAATLLAASSLAAQTQVCSVTPVGNGCGPVLTVTFSPLSPPSPNHNVTLSVNGLAPHQLVAMIWGHQSLAVPIGGGCTIFTDFLWWFIQPADNQGNWSWGRSWPYSHQQFYRMQVATLDPVSGNILVTNCEHAQCFLQ